MRTTARLDPRLLKDAKSLAARTGRTLTAVIEVALRQALASAGETAARGPVPLKTCSGRGPRAGVDLDDSASLLDLMSAPERAPLDWAHPLDG